MAITNRWRRRQVVKLFLLDREKLREVNMSYSAKTRPEQLTRWEVDFPCDQKVFLVTTECHMRPESVPTPKSVPCDQKMSHVTRKCPV
ncbi:hypothetical protein RRG08_016799 [Elysia crispata]|uniref:Uncharacterized protein n=1 Tax=Elysia crispata TaxID=231223 RepID=A0AAE1DQC2_9GAST|nr:hypothetical protein RRG08_016799 [Elysia crispata]